MKLSENAIKVLEKRYLQEGETPEERFKAIAREVASAENKQLREEYNQRFYEIMDNNLFLPNSPALMNYGVPFRQRQGSACFVLEVQDDLSDIFDTIRKGALIHKSGGGTGYNFSTLRPAGAIVGTTGKPSSGVIPFLKAYDAATAAVSQGGTRRGANMGILNVDHPDIIKFIKCKAEDKTISNFNLSVGVTEEFFKAVEQDAVWELYFIGQDGQRMPFYLDGDIDNPIVTESLIKARELFDLIVEYAHKNGEPGIIFVDRLQRANQVPSIPIVATNPCGEQPLPPWNSCVLGSINLAECVLPDWSDMDWEKLLYVTETGTRFLDNIVTLNDYPLEIIKQKHDEQRRIGIGITGLADVLIMFGMPYGSEKARELAGRIMSFINNASHSYSVQLGSEKGSFPLFEISTWHGEVPAIRNAATTTIAPTGTLTTLLGCEGYGAEPLFAPGYMRTIMDGTQLPEVSRLFVTIAKREGFYSDELLEKVAQSGTANHPEVPVKWKKVFAGANEISYEDHIQMQATLQKHVDSGISKTINMSSSTTIEDVSRAYWLAYESDVIKGITIYRDGSRDAAPISIGLGEKKTEEALPVDRTIKPRPRKVTTTGVTTQFKTGCGKMYFIVNSDDHGVCETFAFTGSNGGCSGLTEGVSRLISLSLRAGVDPKDIIDQLCSVRCPVSLRKQDALGKSCPDAMGQVLKQAMGMNKKPNKKIEQLGIMEAVADQHGDSDGDHSGCAGCASREACGLESATEDTVKHSSDMCPWCGNKLETVEGCLACKCGFSKCG